jgi:hypothetical protein
MIAAGRPPLSIISFRVTRIDQRFSGRVVMAANGVV